MEDWQAEGDTEEHKKIAQFLREVDYSDDKDYVPSEFALRFINFIKLVNGDEGEENTSPVTHYKMLDQVAIDTGKDIANLCARGMAKSAIFGEYFILYCAVIEVLPRIGEVKHILFVGDSKDNGVKKMRKRLENRITNSEFLQKFIKSWVFTDIRWEFTNIGGTSLVVTANGAKSGIRGVVELNTRPRLALLDDLIKDSDARSPTVIAAVEAIISSALEYALHPTKRLVIWSGTPFNANDPLYKAIESGAWEVNVFPICERFPCSEREFKSGWPDRFTYASISKLYTKARLGGHISSFTQEMMLQIMSEDDRLVGEAEILWYSRNDLLATKSAFNFYITTDFATTEKTSGDFSVISVWALNNTGDWYWVDGICKKQLMDANEDDLFNFVRIYNPVQVGVEAAGSQNGFITLFLRDMVQRNIHFSIACEKGSKTPGFKPVTDKIARFQLILPKFNQHRMFFPLELKDTPEMIECMDELSLISPDGIRSRYDDFIDTISMLASFTPQIPGKVEKQTYDHDSRMWLDDEIEDEYVGFDHYTV